MALEGAAITVPEEAPSSIDMSKSGFKDGKVRPRPGTSSRDDTLMSPLHYARRLKIFLAIGGEAFEGFSLGEKILRPAPGSIVTSRACPRPANHQNDQEFSHDYSASPPQPLAELKAASREIWGKDFNSARAQFPILNRFPLPSVLFDRKGKSHISAPQGALDNSESETFIACIKYDGELWLSG
jgi:hypothetical protein